MAAAAPPQSASVCGRYGTTSEVAMRTSDVNTAGGYFSTMMSRITSRAMMIVVVDNVTVEAPPMSC